MRLEHLLSGEDLIWKVSGATVVCIEYIDEKDDAESNKDKVELSPIAQLVRALH